MTTPLPSSTWAKMRWRVKKTILITVPEPKFWKNLLTRTVPLAKTKSHRS